MRFKSVATDGYQLFAVTGVNTVSFAIDFGQADTRGLLGFAVEREDPAEGERYFLYGFKVFPSVHPAPVAGLPISTYEHPVQSFVYDDFTAKPDRIYIYRFHPVKGKPKHLRRGEPITVRVRTEATFSNNTHDVFFNRGVTGSQAYQRKFGNRSPDQLDDDGEHARATQARAWLSRDLDEAILKFIDMAQPDDTLLGCFYEFHYAPVLKAMRRAVKRGVTVRLIVDGKQNGREDASGVHEAFPRETNLKAIQRAGLAPERLVLRSARTDAIQHNKFMVLLRRGSPAEVWGGSTNISMGGIHGQLNVGHWVRDADVARKYAAYWDLLAEDPGGRDEDQPDEVRQKNQALRAAVQAIDQAPAEWKQFPIGVTPVFSPRSGLGMLKEYAQLLDNACSLACVTLAFGVNKEFKKQLRDNGAANALTFLLLEKEDKPSGNAAPGSFVHLSAANNTYMAFGSYLRDPIYQWTRETSNVALKLNRHVSYIHSKFLLHDPLGKEPIVVSGSANFSAASTSENDENMLVIRGDLRVADIYFTEFNRLFNHYYFRSVRERDGEPDAQDDQASLFLFENDSWQGKYGPGRLRRKRLDAFLGMDGIRDEPNEGGEL